MVYLSNKSSYKNHIELWALFCQNNKRGGLNKGQGVDKIFGN